MATVAALASTFVVEREPSAGPRRAAEPSPAGPASPAAGWYDDPTGTARRRYWDGSRWTDHVEV